MLRRVFFSLITICLLVVLAWGVLHTQRTITPLGSTKFDTNSTEQRDRAGLKQNVAAPDSEQQATIIGQVKSLLEQHRYAEIVAIVNNQYSQLDTSDLVEIDQVISLFAAELVRNSEYRNALSLLSAYTASFEHTDLLAQLGNVAMKLEEWDIALDALLRSSMIEHRPDQLTSKVNALAAVASQLRVEYMQQEDWLQMREMYQTLVDQHPSFTRFQLELALTHVKLGDVANARYYLQQLQHDPEFSSIAKKALAQLNADAEQKVTPPIETPKNKQELVVPLLRAGNSFLVNTKVNGRPVRLLLDTGASITALSADTIRQLGLEAIERTIQLNTANGVRQSKLYQAEQLRLGSLSINNILIAEVDMKANSSFQGLLGTDVLNQIDQRYSYLIDNQKSALIFRQR